MAMNYYSTWNHMLVSDVTTPQFTAWRQTLMTSHQVRSRAKRKDGNFHSLCITDTRKIHYGDRKKPPYPFLKQTKRQVNTIRYQDKWHHQKGFHLYFKFEWAMWTSTTGVICYALRRWNLALEKITPSCHRLHVYVNSFNHDVTSPHDVTQRQGFTSCMSCDMLDDSSSSSSSWLRRSGHALWIMLDFLLPVRPPTCSNGGVWCSQLVS